MHIATLHNKTVPLSQALAVSETGYHIIQKWKFLHCYFSVIVHTFCADFKLSCEWELLRAGGSAQFLRVPGNAAFFLSQAAGWAATAGRRKGEGRRRRRRAQRDLSPAVAAMGGGDQALLGATSSEHAVAAAPSPGPWEGEASSQAVDAQPSALGGCPRCLCLGMVCATPGAAGPSVPIRVGWVPRCGRQLCLRACRRERHLGLFLQPSEGCFPDDAVLWGMCSSQRLLPK